MIQEACVNWGQFGCHYFNTRDYQWENNTPIYLVKERYSDPAHTDWQFVNVYYYLCAEDYLRIIDLDPDFFIEAEKIQYVAGMNLDEHPKFKKTANHWLALQKTKKVVDQNLQTLRFDLDDLKTQREALVQISDADFKRLVDEFNQAPYHQFSLQATNLSRTQRIALLDLLIEKISA